MSKDIPWTHKVVCGACAEKQYDAAMCNHYRGGKTKFEHDTGVHTNRFSNRAQRTEWLKDPHANNKDFPRVACNGRKNRFHT